MDELINTLAGVSSGAALTAGVYLGVLKGRLDSLLSEIARTNTKIDSLEERATRIEERVGRLEGRSVA
ncbi:MAG: hypothetical protein L0099_07235 [Acidobacteria bacterium]|nr:hypothetical protein [Acidobacteriota bacterium]